jgi:hypothetical protein
LANTIRLTLMVMLDVGSHFFDLDDNGLYGPALLQPTP